MDLDRFKTLRLTRNGRILTITIDNGPINAVDYDLHQSAFVERRKPEFSGD